MRLALLLIITTLVPLLHATGLTFVKERIEVTVPAVDTFMVVGTYWFTSDITLNNHPIFYPFPCDSNLATPSLCEAVDRTTHKKLSIEIARDGAQFAIPHIAAMDTIAIIVTYRQHVTGAHARYILTTTQTWGKPLINSDYIVSINKNLLLTQMSYPADTTYQTKATTVYTFHQKLFMPDKDLSVSWQPLP